MCIRDRAYRIADAIRATGVPVVMGGPHVTELADEALGRDGGPRHADAVALGEADETWPQIVNDAARGELKPIYAPVDAAGKDKKPSLKEYPVIPWQSIDLAQFNLVPKVVAPLLNRVGTGWGSFRIIPVEMCIRDSNWRGSADSGAHGDRRSTSRFRSG